MREIIWSSLIVALVTGYSNQQVAAALLAAGLPEMDGCVFLDAEDRQMILLRAGGKVLPLPGTEQQKTA